MDCLFAEGAFVMSVILLLNSYLFYAAFFAKSCIEQQKLSFMAAFKGQFI